MPFSVLQCSAIPCSAMYCNTVLCSTVQCRPAGRRNLFGAVQFAGWRWQIQGWIQGWHSSHEGGQTFQPWCRDGLHKTDLVSQRLTTNSCQIHWYSPQYQYHSAYCHCNGCITSIDVSVYLAGIFSLHPKSYPDKEVIIQGISLKFLYGPYRDPFNVCTLGCFPAKVRLSNICTAYRFLDSEP